MFFDLENYRSSITEKEKVYEAKDGFYILIEMAGVKKEDVKIETEDNELVIEAERKSSNTRPYTLRTGKLVKRYYLDSKLLDSDSMKATLEDGILEVFIPKQAHKITRKIQIQ